MKTSLILKFFAISFAIILVFSTNTLILNSFLGNSSEGNNSSSAISISQSNSILIYVNSTIYSSINASLMQFKQDLEASGKNVTIFNWNPGIGNDAISMRAYWSFLYSIGQLEGVIFVGNITFVYYEILNTPFPCDLFFMDLDGTWIDNNGNLAYDSHIDGSGDRDPEIWLGRINPRPMNGYTFTDEVNALNAYFLKNHLYRNGTLRRPHRELVYIDDTWSADAAAWASQSVMAYSNQTIFATNAITNDTHYENILTDSSYEFVHVFVHSFYNQHVWNPSPSYTYPAEIRAIDTQPLFYLLFACYAADFSQTNNLATEYLFSNNTLAVIGCTKSGGLYEPEWFFRPLSNRYSIGYSLMRWFSDATLPSAGLNNPSNSYGMTIFGDPTLTILLGDPSPVVFPVLIP